MTAALSPRTGFKFMITVRQGPDQGASYQLLPPRVSIGRSVDSNVVFRDPKISRNAAVIEFTNEQITITDVSSRNSMFVNGEQTSFASIKDGDLIQIGETEFSFIVEALILAPKPLAQAAPRLAQFQSVPRASTPQDGGKLMFYVIIVALIGGAYYMFSTEKKVASNTAITLRTNDVVDKEIQGSEDRVEELVKKRTFKSDEERTRFEEAQKHYLEGFRDYQKGQYMRAMRSFETALAIDPDNQLARRYYKLAEKQRDEDVAALSLDGRRYRDKHMYSRCTAAFEKVLESIPNKDDAKYKEADALRKECELLDNERFQ